MPKAKRVARAIKLFRRNKSRKKGRPPLSREIINLIKRIHKESPLLSPYSPGNPLLPYGNSPCKIHERLVDLNISDALAPNTIAKYIPKIRKAHSLICFSYYQSSQP